MKQAENNNSSVEIWGGVECTVARINGTVHDQLKMNGHEDRLDDYELFAKIGIRTVRYPLLWEKHASQGELFFKLHDERLARLQKIGVTAIAGLLHHGSGPFETDLLQPNFPELLAEYAYQIAKRYPWIEYYTPVNEPLTTARFSGLYGVWYPHTVDDLSFAKIFFNELKGIILSMARIREINPDAKLVQTEDIAKIHGTGRLKYQADLENHRAWLTYDILTGKFNEEHPFWEYFLNVGVQHDELEFLRDNPCPPSICGFNYYVTSERHLDHRIENYPNLPANGNDYDDYVDVECVRVASTQMVGVESLLREAWTRYNLPIALTEVQLACTREEQLRWFYEAYLVAQKIKNDGIDIRGITAWALLGSYDWNTLLQVKGDYYESGVFDVRSGKPRPTALARLIKVLSDGEIPQNTLLKIPGWWKREVRIKYLAPSNFRSLVEREYKSYIDVQPLLIIGSGSLAKAFEKICELRGLPCIVVNKSSFELQNEDLILSMIQKYNPWAIVNTIGATHIDEAENSSFQMSPYDCLRENAMLPKMLSQVSLYKNIQMLTFSSDQVFNGKKRNPYIEADYTDPLNIFGMSKKIAEESILSINPEVLIVRSSLLMNPWSDQDFLYEVLFSKDSKKEQYAFSDIIISPSYLPDLINTALDLLIDKEKGIWHLSGSEAVSYFNFAKLAIGMAGLSDKSIKSIPSIRLKNRYIRPSYSVLRSSSGIALPALESSISQYLKELENYK